MAASGSRARMSGRSIRSGCAGASAMCSRAADDFRALHDKLGLTTVMITHDMTEAILLADRIAVMQGGRLLALGTPATLSESSEDYVGELLRTPRRQAERLKALLPRDGA